MRRAVQPALFPAQPRMERVMPNGIPENNRRETIDPRARRGKRAISKVHALTNREAARIILETGKDMGVVTEWAMKVMEKNG